MYSGALVSGRGKNVTHHRAVLFDLGNTLVGYYDLAEFPPILAQCLGRVCDVLSLSKTDDSFLDLYRRAALLNSEAADHVVQPLVARLQALFGAALPASQHDAVAAAFVEPIFARAKLDPQTLPVLHALRERGVRVGLVSNTPWGSSASAWRAELSRHGLLALLDAVVFCVDVGFRKPHPAPFARALELLNVAPDHTLFVGDDRTWDVAGARGAGLTPILLDPGSGAAPEGGATVAGLQQVLAFFDAPPAMETFAGRSL